jgi:hypothetical protein
MNDARTHESIQVLTHSEVPYIRVQVDQLLRLREILDRHKIRYWVEDVAISVDRKPAIVAVNLRRSEDPKLVQAILDESA